MACMSTPSFLSLSTCCSSSSRLFWANLRSDVILSASCCFLTSFSCRAAFSVRRVREASISLFSFSCIVVFSVRTECEESSCRESTETSADLDARDDSSCWIVFLCCVDAAIVLVSSLLASCRADLSLSFSAGSCVLSCLCSSTARRSATERTSSCLFFQRSVLVRASASSLACSA